MKRIFLLLIFLSTVISVNAQRRGLLCTGNNVNIRTGPGKNYPRISIPEDSFRHNQLSKGCLVYYLGKKQNGFYYVEIQDNWDEPYKAWVSAQYLKFVKLCPECHGDNCIEGRFMSGSGANGCAQCRCRGKGYL